MGNQGCCGQAHKDQHVVQGEMMLSAAKKAQTPGSDGNEGQFPMPMPVQSPDIKPQRLSLSPVASTAASTPVPSALTEKIMATPPSEPAQRAMPPRKGLDDEMYNQLMEVHSSIHRQLQAQQRLIAELLHDPDEPLQQEAPPQAIADQNPEPPAPAPQRLDAPLPPPAEAPATNEAQQTATMAMPTYPTEAAPPGVDPLMWQYMQAMQMGGPPPPFGMMPPGPPDVAGYMPPGAMGTMPPMGAMPPPYMMNPGMSPYGMYAMPQAPPHQGPHNAM